MPSDNATETLPPAPAVGAQVQQPVRPRSPKGVVAVLVTADGRELANAAAFGAGAPAGFSRQDFQASQARRALALATMRALASPQLSDAIEAYTAEQIMRAMCDRGCRVVLVPVGYE
jgi:hypothetical protein